jgi:membrane protein YqaA with SNARE-associated domain
MSGAVFWGLTNKDIGNVVWNGVTHLAVSYAGTAVGAIVNLTAKKFFLPDDHYDESYTMKSWACTVIGAGAGLAASVSVAHRLPFVAIAGEKALKSLIIGMATSAIGCLASYSIGLLGPDPTKSFASQSFQILQNVPSRLGRVPALGSWGYFRPWILYVPAFIGSVTGSLLSNKYYKNPSLLF